MKQELKFMPFGEFLVERGALSRQQLFVSLVYQDTRPGRRIGEIAASLGFVDYERMLTLLGEFVTVAIIDVE